jgi:hypothetical protein
LLISRFTLDGEGNVLIRERFEGGFGHQVFAGPKHSARKTAEQEGEGSLLSFSIWKCDRHHVLKTFTKREPCSGHGFS